MRTKLLSLIFIGLIFPQVSLGAFIAGWNATSTSQGWISPTRINGVDQTIAGKNFISTSTTENVLTNLKIVNSTTTNATSTNIGVTYINTLSSAGLNIHSNNGTDVVLFGAGGGANATFYGGVNIDGATRLATSLNGCLTATAGVISASGTCGGSGGSWATTSQDYYNSQFRDWSIQGNGYLAPTTTIGILLTASSTVQNLTVVNGTTTNATSTNISVVNLTATGSTTLQNFTALNSTSSNATSTSFAVMGVTSALHLANTTGGIIPYTGTSCTNQFPRSLSALGTATCASVANTDLTNSSITINTTGGITGGGSVALGGTLNFNGFGTTSVDYYASQFRDWSIQGNGYLAPTTTRGVLLVSSSTISNLTSVNGTTTNATSSISYISSKLSVASTSPWAMVSINPNGITTPIFAIGSSTGTLLQVSNGGNLIVGTGTPATLTNGKMQIIGERNEVIQMNIQNRSNGNNASAVYVTTANNGSDTTYYSEYGINNSGYNQAAFNSQNAGDTFLNASDGALVLGTGSTTNSLADVRFTAGGTASSSIKMIIKPSGLIGIGTTSPTTRLTISGDTATTLTLDGTGGARTAFSVAGTAKGEVGYGPTGYGFTHPTGVYIATPDTIQFGSLAAGSPWVSMTAGTIGIATTTPSATFAVQGNSYISGTTFLGATTTSTTSEGYSGRISAWRYLSLSTATTTTWTATTSAGYVPETIAPFAGTVRDVTCTASSSQAFLGINPFIGGVPMTPSYFVSSTTAGRITFTANNAFTVGQRIGFNAGTTTTDVNAKSVSCTFRVTETP